MIDNNLLDEFFRIVNGINMKYSSIDSRAINMTYLAKLALIPDDDMRMSTVKGIVEGGVANMLNILSIDKVPSVTYKILVKLFSDINNM
jgi:hypothetical protein